MQCLAGHNMMTSISYRERAPIKVSKTQKQIVKPWILPKNKQMNSFLLLCDVFLWKKLKTPRIHFEITWPLSSAMDTFCPNFKNTCMQKISLTSHISMPPCFLFCWWPPPWDAPLVCMILYLKNSLFYWIICFLLNNSLGFLNLITVLFWHNSQVFFWIIH